MTTIFLQQNYSLLGICITYCKNLHSIALPYNSVYFNIHWTFIGLITGFAPQWSTERLKSSYRDVMSICAICQSTAFYFITWLYLQLHLGAHPDTSNVWSRGKEWARCNGSEWGTKISYLPNDSSHKIFFFSYKYLICIIELFTDIVFNRTVNSIK